MGISAGLVITSHQFGWLDDAGYGLSSPALCDWLQTEKPRTNNAVRGFLDFISLLTRTLFSAISTWLYKRTDCSHFTITLACGRADCSLGYRIRAHEHPYPISLTSPSPWLSAEMIAHSAEGEKPVRLLSLCSHFTITFFPLMM